LAYRLSGSRSVEQGRDRTDRNRSVLERMACEQTI
jgi:hypothetical protein